MGPENTRPSLYLVVLTVKTWENSSMTTYEDVKESYVVAALSSIEATALATTRLLTQELTAELVISVEKVFVERYGPVYRLDDLG